MAVKYRIQYTSVNDIDYTCDISNPDYVGSVIELDGRVEYGMNAVDSLDNPIRSKYLRITVTATVDRDLEDLLTQGERYWRVELYRDVDKIFFGYLTSDQSPQSFTADSWDLTVDALDPMAFLEDLAYVDNTGAEYNGYEQFSNIIANCLKRGFEDSSEEFDILAYVPYDYRTRLGVGSYNEYTSGNFLEFCGIDQDGFIDEDSDEVKSCKEVLEDVLGSLELTITQINGNTWFISHYMYDSSGVDVKYRKYLDSDGNTNAGTPPNPFNTVTINTDDTSLADDDVIHANENQQYHFNYALAKIVYNHEFEYKSSMMDNPDLDDGVDGVSMPGWGYGDFGYPKNDGTFLVYRQDDAVNLDPTAILSDTDLYVEDGQLLTLKIVCKTNYANAIFRISVEYESYTGTTYYLAYDYYNPDGSRRTGETPFKWSTSSNNVVSVFEDANGDTITGEYFTFSYDLPEIPSNNGLLKVRVLSLLPDDTGNTSDYVTVDSIDITNGSQLITGVATTAVRTDINGVKSDKKDIKFNTGNNNCTYNTIIYLGSGRPVMGIKNVIFDTSYRILSRIKSRNELINNKLKKFFTGDFYNFFEPHSIVKIPDLTSNDFRVLEYSFDTYSNVGSIKLTENNTSSVSYTPTTTRVYSETVEPTIK